MIRVTKQQRANAIEARDVMWPSVPPENVYPKLGGWRGRDDGKPNCKTLACFGGWCAWWPTFRAQGVRADRMGAPVLSHNFWPSDVSRIIFGCPLIFSVRGIPHYDGDFPMNCTDHELVTHRLNWLIENSEVIE